MTASAASGEACEGGASGRDIGNITNSVSENSGSPQTATTPNIRVPILRLGKSVGRQPTDTARKFTSPRTHTSASGAAYCSSPGRLYYFTTASAKKRKLTPVAALDEDTNRSQTPSSILNGDSALASPRNSPHPPSSISRTSASPPRFISPRLQSRTPDASSTVESSSRETGCAPPGSPSSAYAGLTLDSSFGDTAERERKGSMTQATSRRRGSDSSDDLQVQNPNDIAVLRAAPRSTSPAKRTASEMEDGHDTQSREHMDVDPPSTPYAAPEPVNNGAETRVTPPSSGSKLVQRHQRSTSVDMLGNEQRSGEANGRYTAASETSSTSNQGSSTASTSATSYEPSPPASSTFPITDGTTVMTQVPSIDEQISLVQPLLTESLQEGQRGFIVSARWLARVMARSTEGQRSNEYSKEASEGEIGPIDSSDLVDGRRTDIPASVRRYFKVADLTAKARFDERLTDEKGNPFIPLRPGLRMNEDFEVFPEKAWAWMLQWYSVAEGSPTIVRYVHDTSPEDAAVQNLQYELYPPIFTIQKLRNDTFGFSQQLLRDAQRNAPRIVGSRSQLFQDFLGQAKAVAGIDRKTKVQLWRVIVPISTGSSEEQTNGQSGMLTPATSRSGSRSPPPVAAPPPKLLIDVATFTAMAEGTQREMVDAKDETMNEKYNGHLKLDTVGLAQDQVLILEEQIRNVPGDEFVSDAARKAASKNGISLKPGTTDQVITASGRSTPAPSGPITRGRARKDGRTRGTVGLINLGNTCYMNSALQCIRSVEELTMYFLEEQYKKDLNPSNPLGYGGGMAKAYAGLLASIYSDANISSFSPKAFKGALGKAQPMFSGYGQQDSQEFLSFLVDALHEDLNRIQKKPYVENPESDDKTVNDPEAIRALGEKFREIHHARNDSVATDLFSGFYKNTMVCPECDKVSITFDPFSLLTLQLPIEQTWQHTVFFSPLHQPPMQIDIDIDKNATIRSLKEYVAKRVPGLKWNRLMVAEIYSHKFYKIFKDNKTLAELNIQPRDDVVVYELDHVPSNFPPPKKKQAKVRSMLSFGNSNSSDEEIPDNNSPLADQMAVPIFHRIPQPTAYSSSTAMKLWPAFIMITREEAQSYDEILRKVLGKVATMTTKDILTEDNSRYGTLASRNSSDAILTTDDDASSNLDPAVQARSVEGEDSVVDVSMTEPPEPMERSTEATDSSGEAEVSGSKPTHPVLEPGSFIPPGLRYLFDIKYAKKGNELIQTGWSAIDGNKDYPLIQSRVPYNERRRSSTGSGSYKSSASDEMTDPRDIPTHSADPNDSGNESDNSLPPINQIIQRPLQQTRQKANRVGGRRITTYSRKHKRPTAAPVVGLRGGLGRQPSAEPDGDSALIRLGEAIILDWNPEAYESLFEDPELAEKKAKRAARRKHGITLEDCFAETAKGEILSEENAWYCNRCKELRRASKTLEIWTLPDILVIHLKRFSANRGFRDKIDVLVDFPTEGLDLSDRVGLKEGKETIYDLFAVDNHYGGLGGGHYTAFAQNFYDKQWYEYNDSQVSQRTASSSVTPAAYLLFYRRRSPHPLGPPYLQHLVAKSHHASEAPSEASSRQNSPKASGSTARLPRRSRRAPYQQEQEPKPQRKPQREPFEALVLGPGIERPPGYAEAEDEGVGLGEVDELDGLEDDTIEDEEPPAYTPGLGGLVGHASARDWIRPEWSFAAARGSDGEAFEDDAASDTAANGSNVGDALSDRMMEDFGDDGFGARPVNVSPAPSDEMPDLVGEMGIRPLRR
ncbi:hypothetical protein H2199_006555 [Coniosporium tulheliwenetii]|uniref:Uncharacterized protein n=1 Tax=Coniosporium tulheliwenetii TaxID=3383036 RepID=A0ACC2YW41_9PEZI|nr:hypothetical protein H2199_006555 [Cladosporium sp. JES 115]